MAGRPEGTERLAAFTDGVLAISMTLLALDVRLPVDVSDFDNGALWAALVAIWPRLFAYGLSFLVVASFWINHKNKFRAIAAADATLVWLNIVFLLLVGLVPFATDVLAESGNAVATSVYAVLMAFSSAMLGAMTLYAQRAGLMRPDMAGTPARARFGVAAIFLLSIPVAFWDADLGPYFWLLLLPLGAFERWREGRQAAPKESR